ncbi:aurora kinase A-interacting protein-like [Scleropages formosus]|uniref:Small ribosomal subunit protein mS38 n=1 Tax=Scleropages formosus TaxID=113540 RepID=A0A0P7UEF7_SCLFO|nr:aurora kinase A-interacting protein-like [Scleropages formosus]
MFTRVFSLCGLSRLSAQCLGPGIAPFPGPACAPVKQLCASGSALLCSRLTCYSTGPAGNTLPPQRWTSLEPELEEALIPRKLSLSPLESWLSLRYSLPPLLKVSPLPLEDGRPHVESVLPAQYADPALNGSEGSAPLLCKNVLKIRRRKMNRHQYKKLLKRTRFRIRKVRLGRSRKKQKRFERDLKRIWQKAGLRRPPKGWHTPKIFLRNFGKDQNEQGGKT